jgi:uncharacterized protein (DUF1499 family)
MLRRRIIEEPVTRLAIWSRRCAVFALAVTGLAVIAIRGGLVEIGPGLVTLAAALVIAALAILLALGAFVVIWREGARGFGLACAALAIGFALLVYPAYLGVKAYTLPALNDITTDTENPPLFEAIARLRPPRSNPVAYPGGQAAQLQQAAYPDVEPLELATNARAAFNAALAVVTKRKWTLVVARPPQAGWREGHIEAVARTPVMGFADDVVVRVRSVGGNARVDIRSASRYGRHDLGTNAARVRGLAEEIEATAAAQSPVRR